MKWSMCALLIGYLADLIIGDPHGLIHPVMIMGKEISFFEKFFRKIFPKTVFGERSAGLLILTVMSVQTFGISAFILWICHSISPYLRLFVESIMCWQCLATKSLKNESMKVFFALNAGDTAKARNAVSMIVGRDTKELDDLAITRAAVETVAENTSDGVIAPMLYLVIGGGPLGLLYKAINTMDSMLGYVEPPYKNIGMFPAKADDIANFIPSRLSAVLMLISGAILKMNIKNGWKIFLRDRYNHKSPNSAQTESVMAGLLEVRLAGDAYYHGVLHRKKYIGDDLKEIEYDDIPRACRLLYVTSVLSLLILVSAKYLIVI